MTRGSIREYLAVIRPRYLRAKRSERSRLLDEAEQVTGYHRKYLTRIFHHPPPERRRRTRGRPRTYDLEVAVALAVVWEACDRICSKRLHPFLPSMVAKLKQTGHLRIRPEIEAKLLAVSPATIDRLLERPRRRLRPYGPTTTRGSSLLRQIPIRTFTEWDDAEPGFFEADLVAHCGRSTSGIYARTLSAVDIVTGWFEPYALERAGKRAVREAIEQIRQRAPVPLLGLDVDNDGVFINETQLAYCLQHEITFTRGRPYHKNDQAHVEQKNGAVIRRFIGYDRFDTPQAARALNAVYDILRLYINFFQPSLRLKDTRRRGARVTKHYHPAATPYQRLIEAAVLAPGKRAEMEVLYENLDPVELRTTLYRRLDELWRLRAAP